MPFRVRFGQQSFLLPLGESVVGRDAACQIQINHRSVSRRHARLLMVGDRPPSVEDLGSRNGTYVDGQEVQAPRNLTDGSEVRVGTQVFTVGRVEAGPGEDTAEVSTGGLAYHLPELRTCLGCRHLIAARESRCPLCGTDQRRPVVPGGDAWVDPKGRRGARRVAVKLRGLYVSATLTLDCVICDLSQSGAFVRADLLDEPKTTCDLIVFVARDDVVRLCGNVARIEQRKGSEGMGVMFDRLGPAAAVWVSTVVAMTAPGVPGAP